MDIGDPAHVHSFKHLAKALSEKGHQLFFTTRYKEHEKYLLSQLGFNYRCFGKNYKTTKGKLFGLLKFNTQLLIVALKFKPDIFLSHGSMYAAQVAFLMRKPHISLEDSGNMEQIKLYKPFTQCIITPDFLPNDFGSKQIRYKANHELAYLHPTYFVPNEKVLKELQIEKHTPYAILRFVSWYATHDKGAKGLSLENKKQLVAHLQNHGIHVFISAERHNLQSTLQKYAISIPPDLMHSALYYATIYIGEGATMASEAGVLGTPSFYVSSIVRYYNVDQEKYGLVYNFKNWEGLLEKINYILSLDNASKVFKLRREEFLSSKIDFTAFLFWFIENYPHSFEIMKENPNYQLKFK